MKKEKYENHLMHNCTEKGCYEQSPKTKLKEEIKEVLVNHYGGFINRIILKDNIVADQILALFEKEKERWAEEIEKMIKKGTSENRYRDGETSFDIVRDLEELKSTK